MNAYSNIPAPAREEAHINMPGDALGADTPVNESVTPVEVAAAAPDATSSVNAPVTISTATTPALSMPGGYALFPDGIYALPEKETDEPLFTCTPIRVDANFADQHGRGWGRLVSVQSSNGQWHEIPITNAELQRRPTEIVAKLVDHGLELAADKKSKDRLLDLLKTWKPNQHLQTVNRMGWIDEKHSSFVLGSKVIGSGKVLPLTPATGIGAGLVAAGNVGDWTANIGAKCAGNPLMILAVSLAFSGPLLSPLGFSGGGLHFRGASSSGKTTLLNLAASVWGDRRLITPWRATSNGLEAIAATMNDMLLPLDEIAEIQPQVLHEAIYMLANGTGKARMTKDVALADQARWRLALISSGEISIEEKLKEARFDAMAGHEVRLIDIEADSRTHGVFDELHGASNAAAFAEALQQASRKHHGAVGHEFVRKLPATLAQNPDTLDNLARECVSKWTANIPSAVDGQISRVAMRFAVIGLAGALATKFGLTGWHPSAAFEAAEQAFLDWYDRRYGAKREAADAFVTSLQQFLSANLASLPKVGDAAVAGADPIGWHDPSNVYLPPITWSQIFPGAEGQKAAKALNDMQMLLSGEGGRFMRKAPRALPGRPRLYTVMINRVTAYKAG